MAENRKGCFVWNQLTFRTSDHKYIISPSPSNQNKIWIEGDGGEGGEFDAQLFFEVIDKFYKENF